MPGFTHAAATTAINLMTAGQFDQALNVLERARTRVLTTEDWQQLRTALEHGPCRDNPRWAALYADSLTGVRDMNTLLEFTDRSIPAFPVPTAARLHLARAWALLACARPLEARTHLLTAIPHLEGTPLGQAHHRLGYALHEIGEACDDAFDQAEALLHGRTLGLCLIDRADCQRRDGDLQTARETLTRALSHLESDAYHLAWAHYNLGEWWLETHPEQAKHHFTHAEQLTHHHHASAFRSRGLHALGSLHRLNRDWLRAEHAYIKALKHARDPDDQRAAAWSAARMQRLQGQPQRALTTLETALNAHPSPKGAIHTERAAALLMLGHQTSARKELAQTGYLTGRHATLRNIIAAELNRHDKDAEGALNLLENIDPRSVIALEETTCFPDLFTFARLSGRHVPDITKRPRHQVHVRACGVLHVTVNEQPVRLDPTGRAAELLVLLLEHDGHAHAETLVDQLYPTETKPSRKYPALWQLANRIRTALGWPHSLRTDRGLYHLAADTDWHYDAKQARQTRTPQPHFLGGINTDWVLEVRRELQHLGEND
jgi:tetratricopeptide (TPR) repeat protein